MHRIKTSDHKFITVIMIMALAFICICSHSDYADWLVNKDQAGVHSTASAVDGARTGNWTGQGSWRVI